jgi:hypothetical protein
VRIFSSRPQAKHAWSSKPPRERQGKPKEFPGRGIGGTLAPFENTLPDERADADPEGGEEGNPQQAREDRRD